VVPGGSCLAREGQTNSGQGWLERSRKAPPLPRVSDTEHRTLEKEASGILPGGSKPPFRGLGPLPQDLIPEEGRTKKAARLGGLLRRW